MGPTYDYSKDKGNADQVDDDDSYSLEHEKHVTLGAEVGVTEKGRARTKIKTLSTEYKDRDEDKNKQKNKDKHKHKHKLKKESG